MYGEIIIIGDELISGRTHDLNSRYLAGRLAEAGLKVQRMIVVGDDFRLGVETLKRALKASRFVIVTGGLGATRDDLTTEMVARALDRPLCRNARLADQLRAYVRARGLRMSAALEKMAWIPEDATVLDPSAGRCGFALVADDVRLYCVPGVPEQMRALLEASVLPDLKAAFPELEALHQRILKVYGLDEPAIAEVLEDLEGRTDGAVLGFYPHFPETHITIGWRARDAAGAGPKLDAVEQMVRRLLGPCVFSAENRELEEVVGELLVRTGRTVAVAESCTGGLIGHRLTNVPGSSAYFLGGALVYGNQAKIDLLGVAPEVLREHGAVSASTAQQMACGVRARLKADLGLAITGIAGPDGGTPEKPVGTVFLGLAAEDGVRTARYRFWGNRAQVKLHSATMAVDWLRRYLNGDPFLPGL